MFQDIINYGNRQGGKQAIADCGFWISESKDMRCAIWDVRFEIYNRRSWIRRMRIFGLQIVDFGLRN